jgi:hypothetical protein
MASHDSSAVGLDTKGELKCRVFTWYVVMVDILSALLSPMAPACVVAIVDRAVIKSVLGKVPLTRHLKNGFHDLYRNPLRFYIVKGEWRYVTGLCWMVYAGTYATINLCTSYCQANGIDGSSLAAARIASGFGANVGLSVIKDTMMTKFYKGSNSSVSRFSRGLFLCRDALTITTAFFLVDWIAQWLHERLRKSHDQDMPNVKAEVNSTSPTQYSYWSCRRLCMYIMPVFAQPASTAIHLWALHHDLDPGKTFFQLLPIIRQKFAVATVVRMCRIFPAIGVGCNLNYGLRYGLHAWRHGPGSGLEDLSSTCASVESEKQLAARQRENNAKRWSIIRSHLGTLFKSWLLVALIWLWNAMLPMMQVWCWMLLNQVHWTVSYSTFANGSYSCTVELRCLLQHDPIATATSNLESSKWRAFRAASVDLVTFLKERERLRPSQ